MAPTRQVALQQILGGLAEQSVRALTGDPAGTPDDDASLRTRRHLLNRVPPPPLPPRICPGTGKPPEADVAAYCKDCSFTASAGSTLLVSTSVNSIAFQSAPSASKIMVSNQVVTFQLSGGGTARVAVPDGMLLLTAGGSPGTSYSAGSWTTTQTLASGNPAVLTTPTFTAATFAYVPPRQPVQGATYVASFTVLSGPELQSIQMGFSTLLLSTPLSTILGSANFGDLDIVPSGSGAGARGCGGYPTLTSPQSCGPYETPVLCPSALPPPPTKSAGAHSPPPPQRSPPPPHPPPPVTTAATRSPPPSHPPPSHTPPPPRPPPPSKSPAPHPPPPVRSPPPPSHSPTTPPPPKASASPPLRSPPPPHSSPPLAPPPPPLPLRVCPGTGQAPQASQVATCAAGFNAPSSQTYLVVSTVITGVSFQSAPVASKILVSKQLFTIKFKDGSTAQVFVSSTDALFSRIDPESIANGSYG